MAEFYLETQHFLETRWEELLSRVREKETICIKKCLGNNNCTQLCTRTLRDLTQLAQEKQELFVSKGVEYCKSECWDSKDLSLCSERCVKDYLTLINDFKSSLVQHLEKAKFYND